MPDPFDVFAALIRADGAPSLVVAARSIASAGVPVFPCLPGGKRPLTRRGFLAASSDAALVAAWWSGTPNANIGIPTGTASGVVVVDVDVHGPTDGRLAWRRAADAGLVSGAGQIGRASCRERGWTRGGAGPVRRKAGGEGQAAETRT